MLKEPDFTSYLNPTLHFHRKGKGKNERRYYLDKNGRIAIVYNWKGDSKWKILHPIHLPFRISYWYTKQSFDSFHDAVRVYHMICSTNGLTFSKSH